MAQSRPFGEWVKHRRQALGKSRDDLTECVGCSPDTFRKIELGRRQPSKQMAGLLAECLRIPESAREVFVEFARGQVREENATRALWTSLYSHASNLPIPLTPLLGRGKEVAAACRLLLRPEVRILTLSGPGGVGKSRLALKVAQELVDRFRDGVYFVALAPIRDPRLVPTAIRQALGLKETASKSPLEGLKQHLRSKRALLLLDNFEQVISAGPMLAELLATCSHTKALVTSREALHVGREKQMEVAPLAAPSTEYGATSEAQDGEVVQDTQHSVLDAFPAVQLFTERAEAVGDFRLTQDNSQAVAQVCARLDGLPLAIELAAARTNLLSPQDILGRLDHRFPLLSAGSRDAPDRHRALQNTFDWSYDLLDEGEKVLFGRLGVFVGGCDLPAVEAICNAHDSLPFDVAGGLSSFLDKSLLREVGPEGAERRFTMLETIREYALERLEEQGEAESVRRLHADYFLALAETAESNLHGPERASWLDRLEWERHNLRAALHWAREREEVEMALRMSATLFSFWAQRGYTSEGREESEETLALTDRLFPGGYDTADRATVLFAAGRFARTQTDYTAAHLYSLQSLETARKLGESVAGRKAQAEALGGLSIVAWREGNYILARQYGEERLAVHKALGDERGVASALLSLGNVSLYEGQYELARRYYEESLEKSREIGEKGRIGSAYVNLGMVAKAQGNYAAARSLYEEALAIWRERGSKLGIATTLNNLGDVAWQEGNSGEAISYYAESITLYRELGSKGQIAGCLVSMTGLWTARRHYERAARLAGAASSLVSAAGYHLLPADQLEYERSLAIMRNSLGEETFEATRKEGAEMTLEQAVAYALERDNDSPNVADSEVLRSYA